MGQAFNAGEGVQANLGQNLLPHLLQNHGLEIGTHHGHHQNARIHRHHGIKAFQLEAGHLNHALHPAENQRRYHIISDGHQHDDEHQDEFSGVRLCIVHQAANQIAVGHIPLMGGLPDLALEDSVGHQEKHRKHADHRTGNQKRQIFTH